MPLTHKKKYTYHLARTNDAIDARQHELQTRPIAQRIVCKLDAALLWPVISHSHDVFSGAFTRKIKTFVIITEVDTDY